MPRSDLELKALYAALDQQRRVRGLSWAAVTREINRFKTGGHSLATSTITGLHNRTVAEGDGILQMLLWLRRTPESFVPGFIGADSERFRLRDPGSGRVLRWDTRALHSAVNAEREVRGMTWREIASQIGGFTPAMLTNLAKGGRIGFPGVMRIVGWLGRPAASFTHAVATRL